LIMGNPPSTIAGLRGVDCFFWRTSFAEHFGYDEDDEGSEKASASQEVYQRVASGGKHGYEQHGFCLVLDGDVFAIQFRNSLYHRSDIALNTPSSCASAHPLSGLYSFIAPAIWEVFVPRFC
jgi:hypothetical protein